MDKQLLLGKLRELKSKIADFADSWRTVAGFLFVALVALIVNVSMRVSDAPREAVGDHSEHGTEEEPNHEEHDHEEHGHEEDELDFSSEDKKQGWAKYLQASELACVIENSGVDVEVVGENGESIVYSKGDGPELVSEAIQEYNNLEGSDSDPETIDFDTGLPCPGLNA